MPPRRTQQALAIAIRTYALFNAGRHRRDGFDLCDSTHCQVPRVRRRRTRARAALATAGRILTYRRCAGRDLLLGVVRRTIRDRVSRVADDRRNASVSSRR